MKNVTRMRVSSFVVLVAAVGVIASAACGDPIVLTSQVAIEDISGAAGSETVFQIEVPYGMAELVIRTSDGTGDTGLFVSKDVPPTTSVFDYHDPADGNFQIIIVKRPHPGTWYIMLYGITDYDGVRLWAWLNEGLPPSLVSGIPATGLSGASGSRKHFVIEVPPGQDSLEVNTWGGTGDVDLYVKRGDRAARFDYDARSVVGGTDESVNISHPVAGTWFIMLYGYGDYEDVTLRASYGTSGFGSVKRLEDEVPITGLSGIFGSMEWYVIDVPSGQAGITFRIFGGTGDCDMYIKQGAKATTTDWDFRGIDSGNDENVSIDSPAAGSWYVLLKAGNTYSGVTLEADYWAPTMADVTPLISGVPVSDIAGSAGGERFFSIEVPIGVKKFEIKMSGGSGDADLYVRKGSLPTTGEYDYRPYLIGNDESVTISDPSAGTWYIMIRSYQPFSGVMLVATYDDLVPGGVVPLKNGGAVSDIAGEAGSELFFSIEVPEGQTRLEIATSGGTGDVDLYVREGQRPTKTEWDYRPYLIGNNETVVIDAPKAGTYYIMLKGYTAYAGVTLTATYAVDESHEG
jgi:hypothetical protein